MKNITTATTTTKLATTTTTYPTPPATSHEQHYNSNFKEYRMVYRDLRSLQLQEGNIFKR
jgi:hypothetical protein